MMTVVHWPDDTRIRERLIKTLSADFDVVYAARSPGPSDTTGIEFVELPGGRLLRNLRAIRLALASSWDVMVIHDPELMFCGILARLLHHRPVVYDVHEDVPALAYTRSWVPRFARAPLSLLLKGLFRIGERTLTLTLAEDGYRHLFAKPHPTFPNYPETTDYPAAGTAIGGPVVYLGDVTHARGVDVALAACSTLGVGLHLIGRITPETRAKLAAQSTLGDRLKVDGLVSNSRAIESLTGASVGLSPLRDLPNYRHSQPTKILEYLAVGLPVVASDLPGTRELVEGLDAVFLVPPGQSGPLAEAISKAREPEVASAARAQASAIRSRFRWPATEVLDFYRSLL